MLLKDLKMILEVDKTDEPVFDADGNEIIPEPKNGQRPLNEVTSLNGFKR